MFCALKLGSFGCVTREQKLVNAECGTCRAAAPPCLCQLHSLILHRKQLLLNPSPYGLEAVGVITPKESPRAGASTKRCGVGRWSGADRFLAVCFSSLVNSGSRGRGGRSGALSVPLQGKQAAGECLCPQLAHPGY